MGQSTLDEIVARYRELRFQVAGVVYIPDKDRHGRIKADRAVEAAQIAGLPLIVSNPVSCSRACLRAGASMT